MTTHFNYWLTGSGWSNVTFASNKDAITLEVSYLSDPLLDMFEALIRLLINETKTEKVVFVQEPGEHVLILNKKDEANIDIEIIWHDEWEKLANQKKIESDDDLTAIKKEIVYTDMDALVNLCQCVIVGIEQLLSRTTIEEYKKKWVVYDFPLDSFNKLKGLIVSQNH